MGDDPSAEVYFGVKLTHKKAMALFGVKYKTDIHEKCPKDGSPNPQKNKYCSECGTNLRYKVQIRGGFEEFSDIMSIADEVGLEACIANEDEEKEIVIIGKKLAEFRDVNASGGVMSFIAGKSLRAEVLDKAKGLGIDSKPRLYLIVG